MSERTSVTSIGHQVFIARATSDVHRDGPRRYMHMSDAGVILFSGVPIDVRTESVIEDAASLPFAEPLQDLEGQFSILRISSGGAIDVVTDPIGQEHVYVAKHCGDWAISNSVAVISRLFGFRRLSDRAVASVLTCGWIVGDLTIMDGITAIPGGVRWRLRAATSIPDSSSYFSVVGAAATPVRSIGDAELRDRLIALIRAAGRPYGSVRCALTGGRDSRLVSGLVLRSGVPATFYTSDHGVGDDVAIASSLAKENGLRHHVYPDDTSIARRWDAFAEQLVAQNAVAASLWQIADMPEQQWSRAACEVDLAGEGGEVFRRCGREPIPEDNATRETIERYFATSVLRYEVPCINRDALEMTRERFKHFANEVTDAGVRGGTTPNLFLAIEYGRLQGNYAPRNNVMTNPFAPLFSRVFVTQAFARTTEERRTEQAYLQLLAISAPELTSAPFTNWNASVPFQVQWLPLVFRRLRERAGNTSALWTWLDRGRFMRDMEDALRRPTRLPRLVKLYYDALSVVEWERVLGALVA